MRSPDHTNADGTVHERVSDLLSRLGRGGYVAAVVLFTAGIYVDWQTPGTVVLSVLSFTDDPYSNSGLFVLAVAVGLLGYGLSEVADRYDRWHRDSVDATQEYTVDVDSEYR